ncbi:CHASE domain-containing protein [Pontibacter cellulosilyticus]|uniref:histidine kinase n=1 Tax=Pontibacter cellulosilyticus TaxID=1720253 RepID=A0A923SPF8_9BACT|nr:CHASE domain-containing protein [Pontibacter cellulosilyticus]MBC5994105.1 CHASE domain-containing protein [Pontibacter cellulosilyticus]
MKATKLVLFVKDYFIAIFSFLLIFLLTLFIYFETKRKAEDRSEKLFSVRADQATQDIHRRMQDHIQILLGAKALFISSDTVERRAWRQYYETLDLEKNYPGIQGLGYAYFIQPENLAAHEQKIRAEGYPDYKVYPEGKRFSYTSIIYLEPFAGRNLRAFGFDMYSEPTRQSAMRIARDTKQPTMSGKVRLVQENGRDEQSGFLIYLPIYRGAGSPESIKERQKNIKGFVYSPYRAKDVFTSILGNDYKDIDIEVYDGTSLSKESLLFGTDTTLYYNAEGDRRFSKLNTLSIANNTWRIYVTAKPEFGRSADTELPKFILLGGGIISLLMFFIIWSLSNTRRSNRLKQTITDNATAALFIIDTEGYCTFMNPAAEEMTGYKLEEMQDKTLHDVIHYKRPDGTPLPVNECSIRVALTEKKQLRNHEDVFIRKNGSYFDVACAVQPIIEGGSVSYTIIEVRDITEEKRAQRAILESEARFRTMADSAPVIIKVRDAEGKFRYVNKQWMDFTGLSFEDTMSITWRDVAHPDDVKSISHKFEKGLETRTAFRVEFRMRRFDGVYRWVVLTDTPRFGANGEFLGFIGSVIDITEMKEAERKVKQNAELLQKLFLEVPAVVGLVRAPDYQYVLANSQYRRLYGNRPLVGKTIFEAHTELEGEGFFKRIEEVFNSGKPFIGNEVAATIEDSRGKHNAYFNLVYQPLIDANNKIEAVLVFAVEVTELVKARQALLLTNDELSHKNKELQRINNDLDNFVYTASHDLKSPIANMEGLAALLREELQEKLDESDLQVLDMVQGSINKLKGTIADLAEITKVQKELDSAVEPLSFEAALQDVTVDIEGLIKASDAEINTDLQVKDLLYARKNLRSILYNLVSNAIKYKSPDRKPKINVKTYQQNGFVVLEVQDNGLGIRKEQQHKLFTMFKRLHSHVEGTGIGLYIVKRIIENNGGRIEVDSDLGKGTTFKVYFKQEPISAAIIKA